MLNKNIKIRFFISDNKGEIIKLINSVNNKEDKIINGINKKKRIKRKFEIVKKEENKEKVKNKK